MDSDLQEIEDGKVTQSVEFVLRQRSKMVLRMREEHRFRVMAEEVVKHLRMSGVRFFRKPPDYRPYSAMQAMKARPEEDR